LLCRRRGGNDPPAVARVVCSLGCVVLPPPEKALVLEQLSSKTFFRPSPQVPIICTDCKTCFIVLREGKQCRVRSR
jgi:hypothetical protein